MTPIRHRFYRPALAAGCLVVLLIFILDRPASAQPVVLHLKSGDQISGLIISETNNQVVISNAWAKALAIPLAEISRRTPATTATTPPPVAAAKSKLVQPAPTTVAAAKPLIKPKAKPKGTLKGEVRLGFNILISTTDQENYSGHLKLTYEQPNSSNPKKFFRNIADFDGDYQRTDGKESANHAYVNNKSDFDVTEKLYGYGMIGTGFDEVQKIDYQFQLGPGVGWHLIQATNFVLNVESGLNYRAQFRRNTTNLKTFSARLGNDFTWSIYKNLKLTENWAFYPDLRNGGEYQNNFTSTLSYGFWKNLSLNLTVVDTYNTEAAPAVANNRFELRSSLGILF